MDTHAYRFRNSLYFDSPVSRVFAQCTAFTGFPSDAERTTAVRQMAADRYHIELNGPQGQPTAWELVVTRLVPNEYLEWRSESLSPIQCHGRARFRHRNGRTRVDLEMDYASASQWSIQSLEEFLRREFSCRMEEDGSKTKLLTEEGSYEGT